jgi:molybdate transport system permease protein
VPLFPTQMTDFQRILRQLRNDGSLKWVFIVPSAILIALFGVPLIAVAVRSLGPDFVDNVLSERALKALSLSLITSTITTLIAVGLGTPLAYMLARWRFKHKEWIQLVLDLPIVLPPAVAGLALLMAFGRNGLFGPALNLLGISLPFTTAAVVLAQTFVAAPLFVRSARVGFKEVNRQFEEAAHVEGANQWQMLNQVMMPLAGRSIASGAILTWTRALGEFGATILFAGNLEGTTQTMPLAIYVGFEQNLGVALVLSVVLIFVSIAVLTATRKLERPEEPPEL